MESYPKYSRKSNNVQYKNNKKKNFKGNNNETRNIYNGKIESNENKFHNVENKMHTERIFSRTKTPQEAYFKNVNDQQMLIQQNKNSNIQNSKLEIENNFAKVSHDNANIENGNSKERLKTINQMHNQKSNVEDIKSNINYRAKNEVDPIVLKNNIPAQDHCPKENINLSNANLKANKIETIAENSIDDSKKELTKISEIKENLIKDIAHPLCCSWTFWHTTTGNTFTTNLIDVKDFDTVEEFWSLVNHMKTPTQLLVGSDFSLFKTGIKPMWEDEMNARGAAIVTTIKNEYDMEITNSLWLDTLLSMIDGQTYGEHFDQICGAVVSIRPKLQRISIWVANRNDKKANEEIEKKFVSYLRDDGKCSIRITSLIKPHGN